MAYKRKYRPGDVITSMDELVKQDFVYWRDDPRPTPRGWFMSWQFRMAYNAMLDGILRYAIKETANE